MFSTSLVLIGSWRFTLFSSTLTLHTWSSRMTMFFSDLASCRFQAFFQLFIFTSHLISSFSRDSHCSHQLSFSPYTWAAEWLCFFQFSFLPKRALFDLNFFHFCSKWPIFNFWTTLSSKKGRFLAKLTFARQGSILGYFGSQVNFCPNVVNFP